MINLCEWMNFNYNRVLLNGYNNIKEEKIR